MLSNCWLWQLAQNGLLCVKLSMFTFLVLILFQSQIILHKAGWVDKKLSCINFKSLNVQIFFPIICFWNLISSTISASFTLLMTFSPLIIQPILHIVGWCTLVLSCCSLGYNTAGIPQSASPQSILRILSGHVGPDQGAHSLLWATNI